MKTLLQLLIFAASAADLVAASATTTTTVATTTTAVSSAPVVTAPVTVTIPAPTPGAVPAADLGASLTPAQMQTTYQEYLALRAQLLEERREAIIQASQVPDGPARWKIFAALEQSQKASLAELRQLHAQSIIVERQAQTAQAVLEGLPVVAGKAP
jgi:hypothetical protein